MGSSGLPAGSAVGGDGGSAEEGRGNGSRSFFAAVTLTCGSSTSAPARAIARAAGAGGVAIFGLAPRGTFSEASAHMITRPTNARHVAGLGRRSGYIGGTRNLTRRAPSAAIKTLGQWLVQRGPRPYWPGSV